MTTIHVPQTKQQPDNLLLFENGTLRICDFGCARFVKVNDPSTVRRANTDPNVGTSGGKRSREIAEIEEFQNDKGKEDEEEGLINSVGTYTFHSPESVSGNGMPYSGRAADAWAAACTLYCWTFGCLPFRGESLEKLFEKIKGEELDVGRAVSPELASLLKGMLTKDPLQRVDLQAALEHSWMRDVSAPPPPAGFVATT